MYFVHWSLYNLQLGFEVQDKTQERMSPWDEVKSSTEVTWRACSPAQSWWPNFTSALACARARVTGGAWSLISHGHNFMALLCNLVLNCTGGVTLGREMWSYIAVEWNNNWWGRTIKLQVQISSSDEWLNSKTNLILISVIRNIITVLYLNNEIQCVSLIYVISYVLTCVCILRWQNSTIYLERQTNFFISCTWKQYSVY